MVMAKVSSIQAEWNAVVKAAIQKINNSKTTKYHYDYNNQTNNICISENRCS